MIPVKVCTYTYIYQQNCSPQGGCTDWELIGVSLNYCTDIWVDDGSGAGNGDPGSGGGSVEPNDPPAPEIEEVEPIPNAHLCGRLVWKSVADADYAQYKNFNVFLLKQGNPPLSILLGRTCFQIPKHYAQNGYDITGFVNEAYNRAVDQVVIELNRTINPLPPGGIDLYNRFRELFLYYFIYQPGVTIVNATVTFHTGCTGPIPVSTPKYCQP